MSRICKGIDDDVAVFWTAFLHALRERGLTGVKPVISDAHAGLKASITRVLAGAEADVTADASFPRAHWRKIS